MSQQLMIRRRRKIGGKQRHTLRVAFEKPAVAGGEAALDGYPGYASPDEERSRRTLISGSIATLLHASAFGFLLLMASLAPAIKENVIPVQLLHEQPPPPDEPAPAPKALAERRSLDYAPAVQAYQPQIVNPKVVADASPQVDADALDMDAVSSVSAPTQISHASTVVERVSAVSSVGRARAAAVDVSDMAAPVVRGPVKAVGPVGPSVGPRKVQAAAVGKTSGTALVIGGNGSSVRDGVLSSRDVAGSPDGAWVVSVDTTIGRSLLGGTGGSGSGGPAKVSQTRCLQIPQVQSYLSGVKSRTLERWVLPPGLSSDQKVTLRFRLDVAGSAISVDLVSASDNALGASAVDALRSASPFPPMPDEARCLSQVPIIATFSNPVAG